MARDSALRAPKALNRLFLFGAALLFSTGGAAIKACSLTSWQVAGFRCGIAAAFLYLLLPGARRGWTRRTWLIGVAYAATMILFVLANKLTTSANAIFLQSTAPLYLLMLGPLVLKEPIRKADLIVAGAVSAGVVLLLSGTEGVVTTVPNPRLGNALGVAAGCTWALTIMGLRWMGKREAESESKSSSSSATATVIAGNLIAFVFCLPMAFPVGHVVLADAGVLLYLGIFQIGLAYILLTRSLREVPAFEAGTLLLLEPVFNPLWSWLIHGEHPSAPALAGGAMIILAALGGTWWQERLQPAGLSRPSRL